MLSPDERLSLLDGTFELAFPRLVLRPANPSDEMSYDGPARCSRPVGGALHIRLEKGAQAPEVMVFPQRQPGTVTTPHQLPTFEGKDTTGRLWTGSAVRLPLLPPGDGSPTTASFASLQSTATSQGTEPPLRMLIPGEFTLPTTSWTIQDDQIVHHIVSVDGGLVVEVHSATDLPEGYDTRVEEVLWFVTGTIATAILVESVSHGECHSLIQSQAFPGIPSLLGSPLRALPSTGNALADMFRRYLAYIRDAPRVQFHPTSADLRVLLSSQTVTIEQLALTLSVAVEGFMQREYPDAGAPEAATLAALLAAREYIAAWRGEPSARYRVLGAVGRLLSPNARSAFRHMARAGPLLPHHYGTWVTMRNSFAHGVGSRLADHDSLVRELFVVHQAFLGLILFRIGYSGPITDKTAIGWPTILFPFIRPSPPDAA